MDTFHRTRDGIVNSYLFSDADCIVYVEGGSEDLTVDMIRSGCFCDNSPDITFWENLFLLYGQDITYEFRAIGSCKNLEAMVIELGDVNYDQVKICMDRDRSRFWGTVYDSVLYTRCYAWENELLNPEVLADTFFQLSRNSRGQYNVVMSDIASMLDEVEEKLKWPVHADIILGGMGASLFNRRKPKSSLDLSGAKPYLPALGRLKSGFKLQCQGKHAIFTAKKLEVNRIVNIENNPTSYCFGHLISEIFFRMIETLVKKYSKWNKDKPETVEVMGANSFLNWLRGNPTHPISMYYQDQICGV